MINGQAFTIFRQFIPVLLLEISTPLQLCVYSYLRFAVTSLIMTIFVWNMYLIWELHMLLCFDGFNLFRWWRLYNVDCFHFSVGRAMYRSDCYSPFSYHGRWAVDEVTLGCVISEYFRFPLSGSVHKCLKLICIYTLLLPEQMDKG